MISLGAIVQLAVSLGIVGFVARGIEHLVNIPDKKMGKKKKRDEELEEELA